jgi:hypothetical protein
MRLNINHYNSRREEERENPNKSGESGGISNPILHLC